ncbi:hypothetical protein IQ07DRAFT_211173 [Pyrenochaeta sp. DS3sAY3a]|nr:hypothetical protein IQ07DRAFT_211173 [Pyrenochaeta sp. DS3sAY3a]
MLEDSCFYIDNATNTNQDFRSDPPCNSHTYHHRLPRDRRTGQKTPYSTSTKQTRPTLNSPPPKPQPAPDARLYLHQSYSQNAPSSFTSSLYPPHNELPLTQTLACLQVTRAHTPLPSPFSRDAPPRQERHWYELSSRFDEVS